MSGMGCTRSRRRGDSVTEGWDACVGCPSGSSQWKEVLRPCAPTPHPCHFVSSSTLRPLCSHFILENCVYVWEAQTWFGWLGTSWET